MRPDQSKGNVGGARRNRTDDLFNAIEALSQLSYGPISSVICIGGAAGVGDDAAEAAV